MENNSPLTELLVRTLFESLNSYDNIIDKNKTPGIDEIFLSLVFCRSLCDFCNSSRAILSKLQANPNFPDVGKLNMIEKALRSLSNDRFFIETNGSLYPRVENIKSYITQSKDNEDRLYNTWKFYEIVRVNIDSYPEVKRCIRK